MSCRHLLSVGCLVLCSASFPSADKIAFHEPVRGLDQLHDVDKLLEGHDRERDRGDNPGPETVDLVGPGQLQSSSTPRACKRAG